MHNGGIWYGQGKEGKALERAAAVGGSAFERAVFGGICSGVGRGKSIGLGKGKCGGRDGVHSRSGGKAQSGGGQYRHYPGGEKPPDWARRQSAGDGLRLNHLRRRLHFHQPSRCKQGRQDQSQTGRRKGIRCHGQRTGCGHRPGATKDRSGRGAALCRTGRFGPLPDRRNGFHDRESAGPEPHDHGRHHQRQGPGDRRRAL